MVTIGALLGMAGHLEGKGASVLDQTGLAQKGGAVTTHIRIAQHARPTSTPCASPPAKPTWCWAATWSWSTTTGRCRRSAPTASQVVLNTYEAMPGTFTTRPDMQFPAADIVAAVTHRARRRARRCWSMPPQLATALMGDAIAANLFMLGYAWQQGLVPMSFDALMRAVELNGAAVEMNKPGLRLGPPGRGRSGRGGRSRRPDPQRADRVRAHAARPADPAAGRLGNQRIGQPQRAAHAGQRGRSARPAGRRQPDGNVAFLPLDDLRLSRSLDELIARRVAFLTEYQNAALREALQRPRRQGARGRSTCEAPGSTA